MFWAWRHCLKTKCQSYSSQRAWVSLSSEGPKTWHVSSCGMCKWCRRAMNLWSCMVILVVFGHVFLNCQVRSLSHTHILLHTRTRTCAHTHAHTFSRLIFLSCSLFFFTSLYLFQRVLCSCFYPCLLSHEVRFSPSIVLEFAILPATNLSIAIKVVIRRSKEVRESNEFARGWWRGQRLGEHQRRTKWWARHSKDTENDQSNTYVRVSSKKTTTFFLRPNL